MFYWRDVTTCFTMTYSTKDSDVFAIFLKGQSWKTNELQRSRSGKLKVSGIEFRIADLELRTIKKQVGSLGVFIKMCLTANHQWGIMCIERMDSSLFIVRSSLFMVHRQ